ncbi:MAG: prephenate dehydrogenase/arogenate dehydrogenase family protein [Gammaproteobacteria bacterium]
MEEFAINRLCIIGVGLIGGSLARALRHAGVCKEFIGCSRDTRHLDRAVQLGVIDRYDTAPAAAVQEADLVVIAVPLGAMEAVFVAMQPGLQDGCVITDVGSAKVHVLEVARAAFGVLPNRFVPGHPIAGTEQSGVAASVPDLFVGHQVILTPDEVTDKRALHKVRSMWEATGAKVTEMNPQHHDAVLAATSHLPHILAFSLVDSLARLEDRHEVFQYAAGGFRDFTRIAASDPGMWRDICLANGAEILAMIGRYGKDLERVSRAIREQDGDFLLHLFQRAHDARRRYDEDKE